MLDKNFHSKHKSGVFTREPTLFCMGKAILHTKPYNFSHTKSLRKCHQKVFVQQLCPHQPPTGGKIVSAPGGLKWGIAQGALVPGDAPGCPLSDPGKGPPTAASHRPRPARNTAGKKRCPEPPDMWEGRWAASHEIRFAGSRDVSAGWEGRERIPTARFPERACPQPPTGGQMRKSQSSQPPTVREPVQSKSPRTTNWLTILLNEPLTTNWPSATTNQPVCQNAQPAILPAGSNSPKVPEPPTGEI